MAGGADLGAKPVVAGGLTSLRAVLVPSLLVNTSASTTMMNTAPAIQPHGVGEPILRSISIRRSMSILRSKSRGSVMAISHRKFPQGDNPQERAWFRPQELIEPSRNQPPDDRPARCRSFLAV